MNSIHGSARPWTIKNTTSERNVAAHEDTRVVMASPTCSEVIDNQCTSGTTGFLDIAIISRSGMLFGYRGCANQCASIAMPVGRFGPPTTLACDRKEALHGGLRRTIDVRPCADRPVREVQLSGTVLRIHGRSTCRGDEDLRE